MNVSDELNSAPEPVGIEFDDREPGVPVTKPWPGTMVGARAVLVISLVGLVIVALYFIVSGLAGPDDWSRTVLLNLAIAHSVLAVVMIVPSALVFTRRMWARVVFTVVLAVWVCTWVWWTFFVFGGVNPIGLLVAAQTVGLAVSAILLWLPASRPFFRRQVNRHKQA